MLLGNRLGVWSEKEPIQTKNYPKFTCVDPDGGGFQIVPEKESASDTVPTLYLDWSYDPDIGWNQYQIGTGINIPYGTSIYLKCRSGYTNSSFGIVINGRYINNNQIIGLNCRVGGNLHYLMSENLDDVPFTDAGMVRLFNNSGIIEVDDTFELPLVSQYTDYCFDQMFANTTTLTHVSDKLFDKIKDVNFSTVSSSFFLMFLNCTSLVDMPDMVFGHIGPNAFKQAFSGCTSLSECKQIRFHSCSDSSFLQCFLNAFDVNNDVGIPDNFIAPRNQYLTLATNSFNGMFQNSKITSVGSNIISGVTQITQNNLFLSFCYGCTNITYVSDNVFSGIMNTPITGQSVFESMFSECTGITTLPILPQLNDVPIYCFRNFYNNTSITTVDSEKMPHPTTVRTGGYYSMFGYCKSLSTVDDDIFTATTLYALAYAFMFQRSTLTNVPTLPNATFPYGTTEHYSNMFIECKSLQTFDWSQKIKNKTFNRATCQLMFCGDDSIVDFGTLIADKLDIDTFKQTFYACPGLTGGTFVNNDTQQYSNTCYMMFAYCNKYVLNITLHTTSYGTYSMYKQMFFHTQNSSNLNHIAIYWNNWNNSSSSSSNTNNWLSYGPSNGTISVPYGTPELRSDNAEKSGWSIYYRVNEN